MTSTALSLPDDPYAALAAAPDKAAFILQAREHSIPWLKAASDMGDVKELQGQAAAMEVYSRQADLGRDAEAAAAEIRVRAERRMGELRASAPQRAPGPRNRSIPVTDLPPRLVDLGMTKNEAATFQKLAALPEPVFEERLAEAKEQGRVTRAAVLHDRKAEYRDAVGSYPFLADMPDEATQRTAVEMASSLDGLKDRPDFERRIEVAAHNAERLRSGEAARDGARWRQTQEVARIRKVIGVLASTGVTAADLWDSVMVPDVEVPLLVSDAERAAEFLRSVVAQRQKLEVVR